jgi:hypothetical protein
MLAGAKEGMTLPMESPYFWARDRFLGIIALMLRKAWNRGVDEFNHQRYWHAHEAWEEGWRALPELEKLHLQALIQAAGAFYLLHEKTGRERGACALARAALQKRERLSGWPWPLPTTCPEIPGLEAVLRSILADPHGAKSRAEYLTLRATETGGS